MNLCCFYYFGGICSWQGFLPDGTAKLLCVPFTSLLSFLVDGKNLESRECAGKRSLGCSTHRQPQDPGSGDPDSRASAAPPPPRPSSNLWCPCGPGAGYRGGGRLCRRGRPSKEKGHYFRGAGEKAGPNFSSEKAVPGCDSACPSCPFICKRSACSQEGLTLVMVEEAKCPSVKETDLHHTGNWVRGCGNSLYDLSNFSENLS